VPSTHATSWCFSDLTPLAQIVFSQLVLNCTIPLLFNIIYIYIYLESKTTAETESKFNWKRNTRPVKKGHKSIQRGNGNIFEWRKVVSWTGGSGRMSHVLRWLATSIYQLRGWASISSPNEGWWSIPLLWWAASVYEGHREGQRPLCEGKLLFNWYG